MRFSAPGRRRGATRSTCISSVQNSAAITQIRYHSSVLCWTSGQVPGLLMAGDRNSSADHIHDTGRPDTPIEALSDILKRATLEKDTTELRSLVEEAYKLAAGLDPYLEKISTPPSSVHLPQIYYKEFLLSGSNSYPIAPVL